MEPGKEAAKKSRNRKLKALRERKPLDPNRLTGASAPSTAYVIMGHGAQLFEKKIVPKGCILVVQVHPGELNYIGSDFFSRIFNYPNKNYFLDPIRYYNDIVNYINIDHNHYTPFAIYREGEEYLDFYYELIFLWDSDSYQEFVGQDNSYMLRESGVAKFPFTKGADSSGIQLFNQQKVKKDVPGKDIFLSLFNKSVYPVYKDLETVTNLSPNGSISQLINDWRVKEKVNIRQSELFEKLGKGVYYNFICRFTRDSLLVQDEFGRRIVNNNQRSLVNSSLHLRKDRPELLEAIREAEGQRQGLIGRLNKSHLATYVSNPQEKIDIYDIIKRIQDLKLEPTKINLAIVRQLQNKHYSLLKEHYLKQLRYSEFPDVLKMIASTLGKTTDETVKYFRDIIDELDKAQYTIDTTKVKNSAHELLLQQQVAKQRMAHDIAQRTAVQNIANFKNLERYIAQHKSVSEKPTVKNIANFKNLERYIGQQKAISNISGGNRTRRFKKYKNKTRRK